MSHISIDTRLDLKQVSTILLLMIIHWHLDSHESGLKYRDIGDQHVLTDSKLKNGLLCCPKWVVLLLPGVDFGWANIHLPLGQLCP